MKLWVDAGVVAATILAVSGCGGSAATPAQDQTAMPLGTVKPGVLTVAYRTDDKPASFSDNGTPSGFYVDLVGAIAGDLKVQATYVASDFAGALPNVRNHVYDTVALSVLATDERKQVVAFSTPISYATAMLVSRKSAPVPTAAAARSKTVAITRGSALIPLLQEKSPGVQVKEFPNIAASTAALSAAQVDAIFTGIATAHQLTSQHSDLTLGTEVLSSGVNELPVATDRRELLKAINRALVDVTRDGSFVRLWQKWNPDEPIADQMFIDYPAMKRPAPRPAHS